MNRRRSRSESRFSPTIDGPEIRALFARDLGIGPTGPGCFSSLTKAEKKVYLEGLKRLNDREREQQTGRPRPKGQPRDSDIQMAQDLEKDLLTQQQSA